MRASLLSLFSAALLLGLPSLLTASSSPPEEKTGSVWYLEREGEEILTLEGEKNAYGTLTLHSGTLRKTEDGPEVGSYTQRTLTAGVAIPGGRLHEETLLALHLGESTILATRLRTGNAGTPPQSTFTYAVIGGTGDFRDARGALVLTRRSATTAEVRRVPVE